tara:strand:- start:9103 stop:9858 length:756 start_codon:yes stop_codon:yes gene_type:complete
MNRPPVSPFFSHALILLAASSLATTAYAEQLQLLSDSELSSVSGREGVLISLDYYLNTTKTTDPATTGAPLATYCGADPINCRFTWQIANRENGVDHSGMTGARGEWLVYKDGYASLTVDRLSLDASFLGDAVSASAAYTSWFNSANFQDSSGTCLLEGACDASTIQLMPALRTHYPGTSGSYDSNAERSTGYNDARLGMYVGGLAVEYDQGGTPGYERNAQGSFAGLSIQDNYSHQAGFAFGGSFYMYGF